LLLFFESFSLLLTFIHRQPSNLATNPITRLVLMLYRRNDSPLIRLPTKAHSTNVSHGLRLQGFRLLERRPNDHVWGAVDRWSGRTDRDL